ncbi:ribonuclease [Pseudoclavibacter endophyticus]|uniref:Ribonuclease n=1 Tax=Pseudoclavibacter endophyticus TaxID=1778590 RepID=A0A6H9WJR2_9MICO|nr:ribonuclease HII [Pseudoclavibacter endophyticus]KAB1647889.1 ribonuclease HII [Pseudoclavibacter endophyticus]GGA73652.1 ribonuclease [Pseudoclavibacter endophyticus]
MSPATPTAVDPTLALERALLGRAPVVIGIDEVGRGAIAGPVAVGACAIGARELTAGFPAGLRDSKLLTAKRRVDVEPAARAWVTAAGVGLCSATEIDEFGIIACLAAAAKRALAALHEVGVPVARAAIVLDGSHDWLSPALEHPLDVSVRPKADRDCAVVSAASVIAKVERDALMRSAHESGEYADYAWHSNVGYGSPAHYAALAAHGASSLHRRTWLRAAAAEQTAHPERVVSA